MPMIDALAARPLPPSPSSPVILMVSGGSDSTALLVRAARGELDLADGRGPARVEPGRLHVLHVNHCLRGAASDGDELFVRDLAARLGVPCTAERVDVGALAAAGANMEEQARLARYRLAWELAGRLAGEAGVPRESARIAVAHTADDRAETFLMRACSGAGAGALAGMRRARGIVVRPLLGETRESLREGLRAAGQGWREDATNAEDDHLRSYMRNRVVPLMRRRNPSFTRTLSGALDVLADEDALLDRLAARELEAARLEGGGPGLARLDAARLASAEPALARRTVRLALQGLLGEGGWREARIEARHIEALLGLARSGRGSSTLPLGIDARVWRGALEVRLPGGGAGAATPCKPVPPDEELPVPGEVVRGGLVLRARPVEVPRGAAMPGWARAFARRRASELGLEEGRGYALADADAVARAAGGGARLVAGPPRAGERMRPFGMDGSKLVSDLLREAGVPARARGEVPVVRARGADGGLACVWVGGIRLDARAAYGPGTARLIEFHLMRADDLRDGA